MNSLKLSISCILILFFNIGLFGQNAGDALKEANILYENGEYNKVIEFLENNYKGDNNAEIEMLLGDAEHKLEFFDMAIHHYNRAKKAGLESLDLYFHRAAAYISIGDYKKAVKDLNMAIKINPEKAELYFYRAYANTEIENYDKAIEDYSNAIILNPDYAEAYFNRGAVRIDLEMLEEGKNDLEKASELGGDEININFNLAIIAYENEDYEHAIELFTDLLETDDNTQKLDAYYYIAESFYQLKDNENACRNFYKAMALGDLDSEEIYHNYCEKGQLRKLFKTRRKTEKVTF